MRTPSGSRPSPWRTPEIRLSPTKSPTNKPSLTLAVPLGKSQECKAYWIFTSLFPLCSWQCTILHKRINRAGLIMTFKPQHQITPYCHIAIIFDIGSRNKDTDYLFFTARRSTASYATYWISADIESWIGNKRTQYTVVPLRYPLFQS